MKRKSLIITLLVIMNTLVSSFNVSAAQQLSTGKTTITATTANDLTAKYAITVKDAGLSYNILSATDKTVEVVAYVGECEGDIVIPAKVNIDGVTYTVVRIGGYAFSGCTGLTSISIPNSVTTIGTSAFSGCSSLTSISIPNSVTTIGEGAFDGCSSLTSINVNAANQAYSSKDGVLYNKKQTSLIRCPIGKLGEVIIPNSVTSIGDYAFLSCSSLTSIIIPNSVTTIGTSAFSSCSSLTSISIPNSVTTIGDYAFYDCSSLTSISIPNSVTTIGDYAFYDCSSLTSISIPNSVTTIGEFAFLSCSSLTSINVNAANQAYSSKDGVLYNKKQTSLIRYPIGKLGEVIIPNSVTSIGDLAFSGCSSLTSISIPNSVTTIGDLAFSGCSSLTSISIPNSVTSIGRYAFERCSSLTSVTSIAVTPPECGESAFNGVDTDNCTLYVPAKSIQAYKQAPEWKEFAKIEAAVEAGIEAVDVEVDAEGVAEVYNLMGVKVADSLDNLSPGIYIVRQGSATKKITVN